MALRGLLRPLVRPWLRRRSDEVARRAARFRIERPGGRELVERLGRAFLGGYHAMLDAREPGDVARAGEAVDVHFRPFFFEGAAMGWLPRGMWDARCSAARAEAELMAIDSRYLYLYIVGLGFWYGFRHPQAPQRLEALARHVEPLFAPLLWDGWGFKTGFFDFDPDAGTSAVEAVRRRMEGCPPGGRFAAWQGLGRSLFFVYMDAPTERTRVYDAVPQAHRGDLELGRSLALAFTGIDRPAELVRHVEQAADDDERAVRLGGVTWALTARHMTDVGYFERCLAGAVEGERRLLAGLPELCHEARSHSRDYADWQARTREAALDRWRAR